MLTVTSLTGQTEVISKFSGFEMYEETNGAFTLSFVSYPSDNNPGHDLIDRETIVEYEGYEFRVKQLRSTPHSKNVSATSTYFDNADKRKYDIYGGTHNLNEFLTYVLKDTGWSFINEDVEQYLFIPDFGNDNVVKLIDILRNEFECEMKIEPGNVLRFANRLGPDNDAQYRYGHNIIALSETIDTTKLKTYIEGFGASGLHVKYTSPYASNPGIGIRHADPIHDDRFVYDYELLRHIKSQLQDYPDSTIELDAIELQDKEIGERVWLIHEKMGIEYQTRVMAKRTKIPKSLSTVILGNHKPKTLGSTLANQRIEIDRNRKDYRSRIDQTNSLISLEVERLDGGITEVKSSIQVYADEINLRVTEFNDRMATAESSITLNAETIELRVSELNDRIATAESSITQTAEQIELKVSKEDYKGDTIVSMINLSSTTVKIQAENIDLVGKVTFNDLTRSVQDTINDKVSSWSLGDLAYQDMVEKAKLGTTIISGGYIASSLLTADNIVVGTLSGDRITGGTIVGSTLQLAQGAIISPVGYGGMQISASDIWFTNGWVDFSQAVDVEWGRHAPVAKFG